MKSVGKPTLMFSLVLIAGVLVALTVSAESKPSPQRNSSDAEQKELIEAQIEAQKAQAAYYQEQAAKLREKPTPSPAPTPKSFVASITDNPASWLSIVGAVIAALVALISFVFNYRATIQNQRDTQFYEALKRFGDKDSPTIRASAAGLLAQLGPKTSFLRFAGRSYLRTAVDQLVTGLLLEKDAVVLTSIQNALKELTPWARQLTAERLYDGNLQLQRQLVLALADYAIASDVIDEDGLGHELWHGIETSTGFESSVLKTLVRRPEFGFAMRLSGLPNERQLPLTGFSIMTAAAAATEETEKIREAGQLLVEAATRLRASIEVSSEVLNDYLTPLAFVFRDLDFRHLTGKRSVRIKTLTRLYLRMLVAPRGALNVFKSAYLQIKWRKRMRKADFDYIAEKSRMFGNYNYMFLPNAGLKYASMSMMILKGAYLQGANLSESRLSFLRLHDSQMANCNLSSATLRDLDLKDSCLIEADLRQTQMHGVQLENTMLAGAIIDDETSLTGTEWWKANFFLTEDGREVDTELLTTFSERYAIPAATPAKDLHESVSIFVNSKGNPDTSN